MLPDVVQPPGAAPRVELSRTPFFAQTAYYCGPASLATILNASGVEVGLEELGELVYLPARRGSLQVEMSAAVRHYTRMPYRIEPAIGALLAELRAGRPVLVFQNLGIDLIPVWHYAVVIGYDAGADTISLRSGETRRRVMDAGDFMDTWERADKWGIVALRPGELPAEPDLRRYLAAAAAMQTAAPEQALTWLQAAGRHWPHSALARFALGNGLYAVGDGAAALAAYREALARDSGLLAARNNLAHLLAERGHLDEALREVEQALAADDTDAGLRATLEETRAEIQAQIGGVTGDAARPAPGP